MRALAVAALGAVGVLLWVAYERRCVVESLVDPGICLDPPQPTHWVTRSPEWDRLNGRNGNSGEAMFV